MFDIRQSVYKADEIDDRLVGMYIDGLMEEFAASPEAQPVIEQYGDIGWAATMLDYFFSYIGGSVPEMSLPDFNEVVFELFPRKVSTEAETAGQIIDELRAFWGFVHRQYELANAQKILETLTDKATERLRKELANPANFGMAKSFFMAGSEAGFDMSTQEGLGAFAEAYNRSLPMPPEGQIPLEKDLYDLASALSAMEPLSKEERQKKRKARKAQRQARKRNRK